MRIIDLVLLGVVLATTAGFLWQGNAAGLVREAPDRANRSLCERLVWLRTPAMHAPHRGQ
jgi:hypothetical protein